jgi:hypothetical protein
MNGQEHYAEAERLIAKARSLGGGETYNSIQVRPQVILAEAQVHATLALAEATALAWSRGQNADIERPAQVTGSSPQAGPVT